MLVDLNMHGFINGMEGGHEKDYIITLLNTVPG